MRGSQSETLKGLVINYGELQNGTIAGPKLVVLCNSHTASSVKIGVE